MCPCSALKGVWWLWFGRVHCALFSSGIRPHHDWLLIPAAREHPPTPRGLIGCATRMPSKARDTGLYLDDAVDAHIGIEAKATIFSFHSSAYAYSCKKLLEEVWYLLALVVQQQGLLRDDRCLQSHCIQLYWMLKAAGTRRELVHTCRSQNTLITENFPFPWLRVIKVERRAVEGKWTTKKARRWQQMLFC